MYPEANYNLLKFAFTRHPFRFAFIHAFVLFLWVGLPIMGQFHWIAAAVGVCIELIYWIGSYQHRDRLRKMNERGANNPNSHHVELWDAAPYNCIHGVKPHKVTHECAWPIMHDGIPMPTENERRIRVEI